MAQYADMPSTSSASVQPDCTDDLIFNLPTNLLDLSLELPDELNQLGSQSQAPDDAGPSTAEPPPEPKQRKKKSKHRPAMPMLRSSRGRDVKTTIRYRTDPSKDDHKHWTLPERRRLLAALKEHGSSDVSKLAQAVRTRSAAAVSLFLMDRRRLKDRVVVQRSASKRAAYSARILRRALNVIRRRYDRSRYLPEVVASCERQPFPEPTEDSIGEMPQFEDLYQMIREVMENHVPAVLGDCELWLFKRMLWTLGNMIKTLDLDATRKDLHKALLWAAAQPPDGYSKPAGQDNEQPQVSPTKVDARHFINFPSMKERKDGLRSSWNPLQMPTSAVQRPWAMIREYLASNASRRSCIQNGALENGMEGTSTSTAAGTTASALASRKKKRKRTTTNEPGTLDAFSAWKN